MMRVFILIVLASIPLGLVACSQSPVYSNEQTWEQASNYNLIPANYQAGDALISQIQQNVDKKQPIMVTTVVSLDNLEKTSTLGRLISEEVASRLTQNGYHMIEIKFNNGNLYVRKNQGELVLTREVKNLATTYSAQAVIVGTYAQSSDLVFVNLKIVQPETNLVLAVHDYVLPLDHAVRSMIWSDRN